MTTSEIGSSPTEGPPGLNNRQHRRRRSTRKLLFRVTFGILIFMVLIGAAGATVAYQASAVRKDLEVTTTLVPNLRADLSGNNSEAARQTFDTMAEHTSSARSTATGPLWKAASSLPFIGHNFRAVAEVAVSADDVVSRAVGPLLAQYNSLDWKKLSPSGGRIDVGQLKESAPTISSAANTVRLSYDRLVAIDSDQLLPAIADPIQSATKQLETLNSALTAASSAAQLLPAMLGDGEERNYLLLVQNSAESRATGGIPGALAILSARDGQLTLHDQSSAVALGAFTPSLEVDKEQERLYTARIGTQMQNVNLTPDFATAANTAKRMWEERNAGQMVDGVIALDPVVLAHLLEATGPVDLSDPEVVEAIQGTSLPISLTKDTVVKTLLSDVYREIEEPAAQDAYFAAVASRVFAAFSEGQSDGTQLIKALSKSVEENRLYLWSSHKGEQSIVSSTALAGNVTGPKAGGASFGAYFNDGTGAKMDYYADRTVQLLHGCQSEGYGRYTVRITVTNTAPLDAASTLPAYVTGGGAYGVTPGSIRTNYVIYGPAQSFVQAARVNGEVVGLGSGKHGQRPVGTITQELAPGETAVIDVDFTRVVQASEPRLQVTPTVQPVETVVLPTVRDEVCQ